MKRYGHNICRHCKVDTASPCNATQAVECPNTTKRFKKAVNASVKRYKDAFENLCIELRHAAFMAEYTTEDANKAIANIRAAYGISEPEAGDVEE